MPSRFSTPAMPCFDSPISSSKLSASECAGSVENTSTFCFGLARANASANAAAAVVFPTPPFPPKITIFLSILMVIPDRFSHLLQLINSTHFSRLQRHLMKLEPAKLLLNLFQPRLLTSHARVTVRTTVVLLLDTIHDQIAHRYTLLAQQLQVPFRFAHSHRFRNRHQRETRLLGIMKQLAHSRDSLVQIVQKNIDLISHRFATRKVSHDVTMFVAHQIERLHDARKNFRQTQQA